MLKQFLSLKVTQSESVADPGGPSLPPIFEAPDYILRPKLRIFRADQSWPPRPNPGSVAAECHQGHIVPL